MATEKQIAANRRNAQLSTGPRTEDGKRTSSLNAYRHGLTGQIEVMTPEEKEVHDEFCAGIVASLNPADPLESQFAQSVAEGHWRLNRARAIENNIFALACSFEDSIDETENPEVDQALAAARAFVADPERFQLLTIYEMRIHRKTQNDLKQLKELQTARRALDARENLDREARRAKAFEEACLLVQLDETEGAPVDPATDFRHPNGFVFSTAEIGESIRFGRRLELAKNAREAAARTAAKQAESRDRNRATRFAA